MHNDDAAKIWQAALGHLQIEVSRPHFETWLKHTHGIGWDGDEFVVSAPQTLAAEWLTQRLRQQVETVLRRVTGQPAAVVRFKVPNNGATDVPSALAEPLYERSLGRPQLNPRYTFERFIVGNSNRLAHAAALGVAQQPGATFNPLFIYGGVGLGKTHLLHAIGHVSLQKNLRTLYVSTEQFTNEFINAIKERRTDEFRAKFRGVDVLLMDDIQFIGGK
ncbi:MAG: chromosomal replication initiator protein DnaA, partial [SAR202 cluster bacterium]|nr:chromosomal replication initiator protein DnaA [SAR202 cluster bacterium]